MIYMEGRKKVLRLQSSIYESISAIGEKPE
jgi:hypothetical protein